MISLKSVSKSFSGQSILENISFEIEDGDRLCIIGQSGSGKSVTLKLMTGLLQADEGEIWIDGENVTKANTKKWNEILVDFGVVFQGAALFDSLNVLENVGIRMFEERSFPIEEIKNRVANSLRSVGLVPEEMMYKFPAELSGGMQKRVGIARAIVNQPRYLFYDEPTTGLDPVNSGLIENLIAELAKEEKRTSIVVTHDMYTVETIATKVGFIHEHQLHFFGTPKEMMASKDPIIVGFLSRSKH